MILRAIFDGALDFLFPKSPEARTLESLSPSDLLRSLEAAADVPDDTLALFAYHDPQVQTLVWEIKYRANKAIAANTASVLYDVLCHELADRALFENFTSPLLIPMPMSPRRRTERGWNQTEILCEELKKLDTENRFEYRSDILRKVRHTESQTLIENKKKRLENLDGSMESSSITGRCVVLLDDVTTTGASLSEGKRALRSAGARKILCITVAH